MIGDILGGIVLYALLGTIANLVFATSITFMDTVLLEGGGILSQFNFLTNDTAGKSVLAILQNGTIANPLLKLMWAAGWGLFGISAGIQIFKLIKNGNHNTSDAWLKTIIRLVVVATLLINWFPILTVILQKLGGLVSGTLNTYGAALATKKTAFNMFGNGSANIVGIEDILQFPSDYILTCIVAFSLGTALFSCTLAYLERFISLAIYCYVSPIAVGLAANEDSQSTLKDWFMGLFPQVLGLAACVALMLFGFAAVKDLDGGGTTTKTVLQCAMATVFFSQARHVEEFFNMMGFKTMRATDAASSALAGAAMATGLARSSVGKIGSGIGKGVSGMAAGKPDSLMGNFGKMLGANNLGDIKDAGKAIKDKLPVSNGKAQFAAVGGGKPSTAPKNVTKNASANRAAVASYAAARGSMSGANGKAGVSSSAAQTAYERDLQDKNIDVAGSNLESVQKPLNGEEFGNAFRGAGLTQGDGKTPVSDTELAAISSAKDITATKADDGGYDFHIPATKNTQEMTMHASPAVINGTAGSGDGGNPAPSSPAPHNNTSAQGGSGRSAGYSNENSGGSSSVDISTPGNTSGGRGTPQMNNVASDEAQHFNTPEVSGTVLVPEDTGNRSSSYNNSGPSYDRIDEVLNGGGGDQIPQQPRVYGNPGQMENNQAPVQESTTTPSPYASVRDSVSGAGGQSGSPQQVNDRTVQQPRVYGSSSETISANASKQTVINQTQQPNGNGNPNRIKSDNPPGSENARTRDKRTNSGGRIHKKPSTIKN